MTSDLTLYGYWRSSAAYRVRIALNLKGLQYTQQPVHLVKDGGQQHAPAYLAMNPQALVPTLQHGSAVLTQSMAIMEYLEECWPAPALLPAQPLARARVRALAMLLVADTHPIGNLRVLQHLKASFAMTDPQRGDWMRHWMALNLTALEHQLSTSPSTGRFCHGDTPGLADVCLIPQLYNARRWELPLGGYAWLNRIDAACGELEAFKRAAPDVQPDAF